MRGTRNDNIWIPQGDLSPKDIPYNELFAMHLENQIRKEHGFPLRDAYLSTGIDGNPSFGGPKILDGKGRSLYFDKQGNTNYKYVRAVNRFVY